MDEEKDVIIVICKHIYTNWISKAESQREFAAKCGIEESTVRRIKNIALGTSKTDYNMSIRTLIKICRKEEISLEYFFGNIKY
ncbi:MULTISPECIES: helix-turn-helix domain-containing protein [Chryseobacterium]|uniref:helix-turn-helix domain-containing protein n=1 Tax=Chryseobacterium TaxID=59732 RepID=UPI0019562FF7|nr:MULTISPECIES: helix-turn-helix transcriptional regulator [Chryseobacterium]MBM7420459.1 transcriptional regulator with XRE-family HTH domain [Chryseobacterium sp. JUb44]MDH6210408.1 transcriptional regulator with XRE-family HTH domain [Chryseobacterium sp. BIGb0186]WSO09109.1 helix-turn-helix transcriptional regulator [Chryseobacterium scophthalmum]